MNILRTRFPSFSSKILFVFFLASFIPTLLVTSFSKSYVTNYIEKEKRSNLAKHAKSYALLTYDKLRSFNEQLTTGKTNSHYFSKIESLPVHSLAASGFGASPRPRLSYYFDENNKLFFKLEKLTADNKGKLFILRGTFTAETLFGSYNTNPFSEPTCVISRRNDILFCTNDIGIDRSALSILHNSLHDYDRNEQLTIEDNNYWLVSWELFLPTHFQSNTWNFVIIKPEGALLSSLKKFESLLIPLSFLFFLLIAYIVYKSSRKMLRPLGQLVDATKDISSGNYNINLNISTNDEFSELASSFNVMSTTLLFQSKKSDAFSRLASSILATSNIHSSLSQNLPSILNIFDAKQISIAIKDPISEQYFDTYAAYIGSNGNIISSKYRVHYLGNSEKLNNAIYGLNNNIFKIEFSTIHSYVTFEHVWIKEIEFNRDVIGLVFLGTDNTQLENNSTEALNELSEQLSIIYTTYKQQSQLYLKAHYDDLTNLPNRNYLLTKLKALWGNAVDLKKQLAMLFIDLDHFKNVNDLSGHAAGNEVLIEVANRLKHCISANDYLARLSGDEFCIVVNNLVNSSQPVRLAEKIIQQFKKPFIVKDMSYFLGASIGIAIGPSGSSNSEQLIEKADLAMFKAKQEGRNQFVLFDTEIENQRSTRLSLERDLHFALESNEISLRYQPKIELATNRLISVEALARWHHKELGLIQTDEFIRLAEESGLILEIGKWILRRACYQYMDWIEKKVPIDTISVNVSARQLASRKFSSIVKSTLEETGIAPHCLELEITESAFIHDEAFLTNELNKLHNLDVKISIDDFGKEYSSLNYLKRIPFDTLKIDREFIVDLEKDKKDQHIVEVIINIGHILEKKIVAEGIETTAQLDILKSLCCNYGQGFLFSPPLSEIEFLEYAIDNLKNRQKSNFEKKSVS